MKNKNSGQIFPFCLFLILILLLVMISNFEIGFRDLKKIQQQKKLDGVALDYATDYARALNGLAALNEGLRIATQRGQMMATAYTLLAACSPLVPACAKAFAKLSVKIKPFFDKLNQLGRILASQQGEIITWMIKSRSRSSLKFLTQFDRFYLYPDFGNLLDSSFSQLPFYRPKTSLISSSLGKLPVFFDVPAPLVFKSDFFTEKNKIIFIAGSDMNSIFKNLRFNLTENVSQNLWSLTEVKIEGQDFQKMKFKPYLSAISLEKKLWVELRQKTSYQMWPNLLEISNEIAH